MSQLVTQALEIASLRSGDRARSITGFPGHLPDSGVDFADFGPCRGAVPRTAWHRHPVSAFSKLPIDLR
jgi:hypothetical protein